MTLRIQGLALMLAAACAPALAAGPNAERDRLVEQISARWAPHAEQVYQVDRATWRKEMAPAFEMASLDELRAAAQSRTFEAMGDLVLGIDTGTADGGRAASLAAGKALGSLANDLVYTPVQPCRVVDTRLTAAGPIGQNGSRNFIGINASSFSGQGGSATNCGTLGLSATALALNVTVVSPANVGYVTVYPYGTSQPLAATMTYQAGQLVTNSTLAQIPNPLASFDYVVFSSAQAHVVIDIVGYFAPPVATAVQCVTTATTVVSVPAGGQSNTVAPACAAGYTQTATNCEASSWTMPFVFMKDGTCSAQNNGASAADLRASRTCCRVPGR